jgi:hypothetical protein
MAIGWPEAIDGAPRRGLTAKEGFLVSRGMTAQPTGEESLTRLLRHRRSRRSRLRPDQAIGEAVWSGRVTGRKGEMAAHRCRQEDITTDLTGELCFPVRADHGILTRPASGGPSPHQRISALAMTADAAPAPAVGRSQGRTANRFPAPQPPALLTGIAVSIVALVPHYDGMRDVRPARGPGRRGRRPWPFPRPGQRP